MKSTFLILTLLLGLTVPFLPAAAQEGWPRSITASDGSVIKIYAPQPDSFRGNLLKYRSAFSVTKKGMTDPQFGSFLALAGVETDRDNRLIHLLGATILSMNFTAPADTAELDDIKQTLECGIPGAGANISLDEILSSLDQPVEGDYLSKDLNNNPPAIVLATRPTFLVLIDGRPRLKRNKEWDLNVVANSPYTIVESSDSWFYLYGGRHWYIAPTPAGPFHYTGYVAPDMRVVENTINQMNYNNEEHTDTLREGANITEDVIVATEPAALIQTKGAPVFAPVNGTSLLYVTNTNNDLFLDSAFRRYYVLLSGRWFQSRMLTGPWTFVPADSIPADFSKILEGSPKDNVLVSVPGTAAAREALLDACIPQTARIDRHTASASVIYDGNPKFRDIPGTHLQYALNTTADVLLYRHKFYTLEKAVWFSSEFPKGPWELCTQRPGELELIPPGCPAYHCKYVYIYGATADYVYAGYTAGYLNSFISGSTLVYGTGYLYPSWVGDVSYPRPSTWGFNMWYNPWVSWCLGYDLGLDWFNTGIARGEGTWAGGWWGPSVYRPPYVWHHFSGHGIYQKDVRKVENIDYNNNIYQSRTDVVTRPLPELVYTDPDCGIYRRDSRQGWWKRVGGEWKPLESSQAALAAYLNTQEKLRERGDMRWRNFQQMRGGAAGQSSRLL